MKYLYKFIFRIIGWKITDTRPQDKKAIIIAVPHTSAWDFIIGKIAFGSMGMPISILIKKEFFKFPIGPILRSLGAISVDRGNKNNKMVEQLVDEFNSRDMMYLSITPEGSRKKRDKWKRGFYEIAQAANVPVYIGKIDYGKKLCDVGERFIPTGDYEKDIEYIQTRYKDVKAKNPECFSWGEKFYGQNK